jgi:hypothetical protein
MMKRSRQVPLVIDPAHRERGPALGSLPATAGWAGGGALSSVRPTNWLFGGVGDYFPTLTWENRPDMAGTGAPRALQDAWVAVVMAVQQAHGGLRRGSCYHLNLAGAPLVQKVLGEPVDLCAGYGGWIEHTGMIQTGFRWRPSKWADWIDADAGRHLEPTADVHCWLESSSHLVDLDGGAGAPDEVWPPLIFRRKTTLLKHPREAQGAGEILLWRSAAARELVGARMVPLALPIAARAVELFENFTRGTPEERHVATMQHEMIMRLGRHLAPDPGGRLTRGGALPALPGYRNGHAP